MQSSVDENMKVDREIYATGGEAPSVTPALPRSHRPHRWRCLRIGRAVAVASALAFLFACSDPAASLDRKMSEIRREQCDPLPNEAQRLQCIHQVNDIEDNALRRLDQARQQQVIQLTVDQMHVINQGGPGR